MPAQASVSADEWDVWRAFVQMRRQLDRVLERELQKKDISVPDYEILITLFEAPERRLRAQELGQAVGWEKSRLSHQVTRMEKRGLVERTNCDTDARGTWIGITPDGRRSVLGAMGDHSANLRRFFFDVLTDDEKRELRDVSDRVIAVIDPAPCEVTDCGSSEE